MWGLPQPAEWLKVTCKNKFDRGFWLLFFLEGKGERKGSPAEV